jgi:hypothetical protein
MGVVFLAEDPQLKRLLAVKALKSTEATSAEARQRFLREAQAVAAISHDHVITIYQVGEANGVPFLAMPLLRGESLEERLQREGRLPLPEVLRIGREMAEGLEAAHACGLVHRDIKPSNVWLDSERGGVKLLDFGLARGKDDTRLTQVGCILGTPAYMAPEQADSQPVDLRCDLYSLGCVLYRMSTGKLPFQGKDAMTVLKKVLLETPRPLLDLNPEAPPELGRLVAQLMTKDPVHRPTSARVVAAALRALEGGSCGSGRAVGTDEPVENTAAGTTPRSRRRDEPPDPTTAAWPRRRRRKAQGMPGWGWALIGGAILGLGLVVAVVIMARRSATQPSAVGTPLPPPVVPKQPLRDDTPEGWQSFSPPAGRFAVLLPGEPKAAKTVSETQRGPIQTHTFTIEVGPNTYAVSWFDLPGVLPRGPQIRATLDGGQKGLLDKLGRVKVLKDKEISIDGFPGKEVVVENAERHYTLTARLYLVGQRIYTLLASAPLGQDDAPDVRVFFGSFRLLREHRLRKGHIDKEKGEPSAAANRPREGRFLRVQRLLPREPAAEQGR